MDLLLYPSAMFAETDCTASAICALSLNSMLASFTIRQTTLYSSIAFCQTSSFIYPLFILRCREYSFIPAASYPTIQLSTSPIIRPNTPLLLLLSFS